MRPLPPDLHAFLFDDPHDDPILRLPETIEFLQLKSWAELLETLPRWKALEGKGLSKDLFSIFLEAEEILSHPSWRPYFGPVAHLVTPFWLACYTPESVPFYLQEEYHYIYVAEDFAPYIWAYFYFPLMQLCNESPHSFPKYYLDAFVFDPIYLSARFTLFAVYSDQPDQRDKLRLGLLESLKYVRKKSTSFLRARRDLPMIHSACFGHSDRSLIQGHFRDIGMANAQIDALIDRLLNFYIADQNTPIPTIDEIICYFAQQEKFYPDPITWSPRSFSGKSWFTELMAYQLRSK